LGKAKEPAMTAVVLFESMFGNTEKIARAVAAGMRSTVDVTVVEVGSAPERLDGDVQLLVVGGPTHAFGMSRPGTRDDARRRVGDQIVSRTIGLRDWLGTFTADRSDLCTATFDTRIESVRHLPGSAARGAAKLLRRRGYERLSRPRSFFVLDVEGPLADGEVERARRWGEQVAQAYQQIQTRSRA
jgi:hypothetical protein